MIFLSGLRWLGCSRKHGDENCNQLGKAFLTTITITIIQSLAEKSEQDQYFFGNKFSEASSDTIKNPGNGPRLRPIRNFFFGTKLFQYHKKWESHGTGNSRDQDAMLCPHHHHLHHQHQTIITTMIMHFY